jgi:hypothetical protein
VIDRIIRDTSIPAQVEARVADDAAGAISIAGRRAILGCGAWFAAITAMLRRGRVHALASTPVKALFANALVAKDITRRVITALLVLVAPFEAGAISEVAVEEALAGLLAAIGGLLEARPILASRPIRARIPARPTVRLVRVRVDALLSASLADRTLHGSHHVGGHIRRRLRVRLFPHIHGILSIIEEDDRWFLVGFFRRLLVGTSRRERRERAQREHAERPLNHEQWPLRCCKRDGLYFHLSPRHIRCYLEAVCVDVPIHRKNAKPRA